MNLVICYKKFSAVTGHRRNPRADVMSPTVKSIASKVVTLVDELAAKEVLAQIHHELTGWAQEFLARKVEVFRSRKQGKISHWSIPTSMVKIHLAHLEFRWPAPKAAPGVSPCGRRVAGCCKVAQ